MSNGAPPSPPDAARTEASKRELRAYYAECGTPKPAKRTPRERVEKRRKRIPKISDEHRARLKLRAQIRAEKVAKHGRACQLKLPGCTGTEQGLHHLEKARSGDDSHENTLLACNHCNLAVEASPELARKLGLSIGSKI